ncbi:uncharacterized protein [Littorina saxatilis]|uniref:uncharacterized protein n=1 Tax=Littorina saxatilis TaxID=31220 RepID=UPI0038B4ECFB
MVTSRPSAHAQVDKFRHVRDAICILFTAADSLRFEMSQKFPPNSRGSMLLKLALNQLKATAETPSDGIVQVEEVNKTDNRTNTIGFNARPGRPPELSRSLGQGTRQGFHQSAESAGGRDRDEKSRDSESSRMRRSQSCSPGDSDRSERSCRSRSKERARRSRSPREDKLKEEKERDKERDRSREKERDKDSGRDRCSRDDNRDRDPVRTDRERSSGQERDRDQDQFEREKRDRDRSPRESRSREDDPDKERKDRDSEGDSDSGRDRGRGRDEGRGRNRDRDAGRDRDGGRDRDKGKNRYREREGRQRERNQEREDEVRFVKTGWRSGGDCDRNREDSGGRGGHRGNDRRDFPGRQGCPPQSSRSPGQGARPKTSDGRRGFRQPAEPAREWSSYSDSDDDYLPGSEDDTDSSNNDATAPCGVPGTTSEPDESIIYPFLRKSDGASWSPGIPSESLKAAGLYTSSQPPSSSSSRSITRPSGSKSSSQPASKPSDSGRDRGRGRDEGRGRNRDRDIDAGRDRDGGRDRDKGKNRYREREGRQRERNQEREGEDRFVKTGWRSGGDCDRNREDSGGRGGHRGNDRRDFPGRQGCPPQSSRSPGQGARPKTSDGRRGFRQPAEPAREWSSYSDSDDDYLPGSEDDTDSSNNDATAPCGVPGTTSESDESIIFPFLRKSDGARWSPGIPSESLKAAGLYTSSQPPSSSSSRSITRPSGSKSSSQPASKPSSSTNTRPSGIRIHIAANTNGKRVYDKENWCKFCNSPSTNLAKHQFSKHKKEPEIVEILSNPKNSAERRFLLERVRNLGNYNHNCRVLKKNKGKLIPWRSPSEKVNPLCYIPCEFCLGFFVRNELWRHQQRCKFRKTSKNGRNVISRAESLLPSNMECSGGLKENIFDGMHSDGFTFVAKRDHLIVKFGEKLYQKHGHLQHRRQFMRQKIRELARFLLVAREEDSTITALQSCIRPDKFLVVISAVKKLCGYDSLTHVYENPSLALKIGHSLKKCATILRSQALIEGNSELQQVSADFVDLCDSDWKEHISSAALSTLASKQNNKPHVLPLTEDMKKVTKYMAEERERCLNTLRSEPTVAAWHALAKVSLSNIIMFNRRRSGEAARILLTDFEAAKENSLPEDDILSALSDMEKELVAHFTRVEVCGKRGRRVPVLLTKAMHAEIEQLLLSREEVGVRSSNPYVFARPYFDSEQHLAGHTCLKEAVEASGAQNPQNITSTKLRKHLATVSQILNLSEHELEQVCGFLGHNILVHREYYRLPSDTYQLAKVSRLLMAAETGEISKFQGKSLSDIHLNKDLEFQDSEIEEEEEVEIDDLMPAHTTSTSHSVAEEGNSSTASSHELPTVSSSCQNEKRALHKKREQKPWRHGQKDFLSPDQNKAICTHFSSFIDSFRVPAKADCDNILAKEPLLQAKSWLKIKCTVRNAIEKRKRELKRVQNPSSVNT